MSDDINRLKYTNAILADACTTHRARIEELKQENYELSRSIKKHRLFIAVICAAFTLIEFYPF